MCELEADIAKANNGAQGSARQFKEEYIMVVQHNLTAMNSNRMLGLTQSSQAKSTEKLSSGYKINRAADDAAGLSISEKMRKQIRGLTQASANAEDGISTVQTAEGALNEVQDMLQRMNELAVKASNGTNSENDRSYIQNEIDQLTTEIDRVAETTKFNETYLLKGDKDAVKGYSYSYGETTNGPKAATICGKLNSTVTGSNTGSKVTVTVADPTDDKTAAAQNELLKALQKSGARITIAAGVSGDAAKVAISVDGYDVDSNGKVSKDGVATGVTLSASAGVNNEKGTTALSDTVTLDSKAVTKAAEGKHAAFYDKDGNKLSENALSNYFTGTTAANGTASATKLKDKTLYDQFGNEAAFDAKNIQTAQDQVGSLKLSLHVGADATTNNKIELSLDAMSAKGLGVNGLRVDGTTSTNADNAIETIKEAIQKVSTQRSALGAVQNRLEHTISNLDNVVENTTSAESAIRDTDMATEMVKYSNNNILSQAGQAMLAQANQSNQGVLSLLQ